LKPYALADSGSSHLLMSLGQFGLKPEANLRSTISDGLHYPPRSNQQPLSLPSSISIP